MNDNNGFSAQDTHPLTTEWVPTFVTVVGGVNLAGCSGVGCLGTRNDEAHWIDGFKGTFAGNCGLKYV